MWKNVSYDRPGKRFVEAEGKLECHQERAHCLPSIRQPGHQVQLQHFYRGNCSRYWWDRPWTTDPNRKQKIKWDGLSKWNMRWGKEGYLNPDIAFANIEILEVDLLAPFLFPEEVGSEIRPKSGGVLDGPFIHVQILRGRGRELGIKIQNQNGREQLVPFGGRGHEPGGRSRRWERWDDSLRKRVLPPEWWSSSGECFRRLKAL